jgi:uncharacterized membrane protein
MEAMMQYEAEVTINLPRKRVIELFDSTENLYEWQTGLKSFKTIEGVAGQPGARSEMIYDTNGRKLEMIETIVTRNFPDEFSGTYTAKNVYNSVANRFYEEGPEKTRWVIDTEFQFSSWMKLIGIFMKGAFPKQTLEQMNQFKDFAERA